MTQNHQIYLFGDQTYDIDAPLRALLLHTDPILTCFFERTFQLLRLEISQLPGQVRYGFPRFSSIADLVSRRRDTRLHSSLEMSLVLIYQLASFIRIHSEGGLVYPTACDTHLLGLCTGAFAAAAISCSRSLAELLPAAVQTVLVAFRTSLCAGRIGHCIEPTTTGSREWSLLVSGMETQEIQDALREFSATKPYISAHAPNGLTVSGPPSILDELRQSPAFARVACKSIPIHAPYHSPVLFTNADVEEIVASTISDHWASYRVQLPVISGATGRLIWAGNFRALLLSAIEDVLLQPIHWLNIQDGFNTIFPWTSMVNYEIIPIATQADSILSRIMQQPTTNPIPALLEKQQRPPTPNNKAKIAIVGMSGRFPGADNTEALWELLSQGLDLCKEVPASRWSVNTHVDPTGKRKNTSKIPWGCWLDNPDLFDARFFNMSPREAPQVDPAQRIALLTAYEAIEQAGIVPGRTPSTQQDRVGVFFGTTSNDWCETNSGQDIDTYYIPGANRAFIPGRINYVFKFSGPSYSIDTACSSSLSAIHVACNSLWQGDIDTAIAGGTNCLTNPDMTAGLDRGHFLSPTGNCKTFDEMADGYCRGEGVATVVLKRLDDALADHDPILGVILDAYTNHSAEAESITRPHIGAQKAIFERILNRSGVHPYDVSYIEMHGTGTQAGDSREMASVLDTFAPYSTGHQKRSNGHPLYLGAIKPNIGHGESVSGVTALVKTLLMMQKNMIPPHCGVKTRLNQKFPTDLAQRNVHIAFQASEWLRPQGQQARRAFINNFSAAGGNSSILVEDAPAPTPLNSSDPRSSHVVTLSAKCPSSLKSNVESLLKYLRSLSSGDDLAATLPQLSYTTTARRIHHLHRLVVTGSTMVEIASNLQVVLEEGFTSPRSGPCPKVVFTFTGQGAQYPGMGQQLFNTLSLFRSELRRFDQLAQSLGLPSFLPIFLDGTGSQLDDFTPTVVQLANTCMQIALTRVWGSWGIKPSAVVGHSLGEYAALNIAGVLSDADTIFLVGRRAQLLEEKCHRGTHAMLAILASSELVRPALQDSAVEIACINAPGETVVAGPRAQIAAMRKTLTAQNVKCTLLQVPFAFHSSQVDPILKDFELSAKGVTFRAPSIPVISPLLGTVISDLGTFSPEYLTGHCRKPVNMLRGLTAAFAESIITPKSIVIEFGPHPVVFGMVKSCLGNEITCLSTLRRNKDPWKILADSIATLYRSGADIDWSEYHRDFSAAQRVLPLPSYSWDLKSYWIPYKNDWTLYKGEHVCDGDAAPAKTVQAPPLPAPTTTTLHRLVEEKSDSEKFVVVYESDVSRPDLNPLVQGHKVEGLGLYTPSVYADIGFTLGNYFLDRFSQQLKGKDGDKFVDIINMVIEKALIAENAGPQFLRVAAELDWSSKEAAVRYYSVDSNHVESIQHAHCRIRFSDKSTFDSLAKEMSTVQAHMKTMRDNSCKGAIFRFNGPMAYNMVQALAEFHPDYRCIDETILDNETLEAACTVSFGDVKKGGTFHTHPGFIDGLTQSGGFVMNANTKTNLAAEVFVNHGWDSFQLYESVTDDRPYQTYVQMTPGEAKQWKGNVVILSGDRLVGSVGGLTLQGVPRRILRYILKGSAKPSKESRTDAVPHKAPARIMDRNISERKNTPPNPPKASSVASAARPIPPTTPQAHDSTTESRSDQLAHALRIISDQSNVPMIELIDDAVFADLGVDSLLALTITSAFSEELDLDLDSSFFIDHPTVADLKEYFGSFIRSPPDTQIVIDPAEARPTLMPQVESSSRGQQLVTLPPTDNSVFTDMVRQQLHTTTSTAHDDIFQSALRIIADESGVSPTDLTGETAFADIGIDSLLALIIGSRLSEELTLDIDAGSFFQDCVTVPDLRNFLQGKGSETPSPLVRAEAKASATQTTLVSVSSERPALGPVTEILPEPKELQTLTHSQPSPLVVAPTQRLCPANEPGPSFLQVLEVISKESGVEVSDLSDETVFADIGVDSLLALVIGSRIREELLWELDVESMLISHPTVKDLKLHMQGTQAALQPDQNLFTSPISSYSSAFDSSDSFSSTAGTPGSEPSAYELKSSIPSASSVVLQGSPRNAGKILFLFPDGSGSATSYTSLPRIAADLTVIGLNSPFLKNGSEMRCTIDELVGSYLEEVCTRQATGPYHLAGWSAGGILAYRAAQMLVARGDQVPCLALLDAPPPMGLGKLPQHFFDHCDAMGIFGQGGKAPEWLIPHFKGTNAVLSGYYATPFATGQAPTRTGIIWASQSVFDTKGCARPELHPDDTEDMKFLTETRTDFSAGIWGLLFPGAQVVLDKVEGADHFSMMVSSSFTLFYWFMTVLTEE
ncbi:type I iterative polyketide synthase [Penicillium mononematosum]|uniref:type I iterative polyketide synthase n=1 Tax=Penicillium mononematosum TaxID=268346 RepID=UPI0025497CDD|nr:type I iterative polyketide synthase [Penicillium mononematosum]KAJ6183799.1 type I iterative polyketide synthase [Penicillium mononematosum]